MVGSQKLKALQGLAWFGDHPDRWLTYDDFRPLTRRRKESAKSIWMNIHPWATKPRVKFSRPSKANRAKNRAIAGNDQDSDLISSGDDDPISVDDDDLISVRDNDLISIEDDPPISIRHDHLITEPPTLAMDAPEARADEERQLDARRHRTSVYPAPLPAFPGQAISRGEIRSVPTGSANTSNVDAVSSRTRSSRRRPIPNPHDDNGSCILGCSHVGAGDYTVPTLHPAVGTTLVPSNASSEQPHEVQVFGPVSGYISGFTQPRSSQPVPSGNVLDAAQAQPLPAVTCAVSQPSTTTTGVLPALAEGIGSTPKEGRFKQRIIVNLPKPVRPAANHVEEMIPAVKDPLRHVSLFVGARCGDSARLSSLTALSSGVDSVNDAADTQVRQFHQAMKRKRPADDSEGDVATLAYKIRRLECGVSDRHTANLETPQPHEERAPLVGTAAGPLTNLAIEGRVPRTPDNPFGLNHKEILDACLLSQRVREWMGPGFGQNGGSVFSTYYEHRWA